MFQHKEICQEWYPGLVLETTGRRTELDHVFKLRIYLQLHRIQWIFLGITQHLVIVLILVMILKHLPKDRDPEMTLNRARIVDGGEDHIPEMNSGVVTREIIPMMTSHRGDIGTMPTGVGQLGLDLEIVYSLIVRIGDEGSDLIQEMLLRDTIDPDLLFLRDRELTDTT